MTPGQIKMCDTSRNLNVVSQRPLFSHFQKFICILLLVSSYICISIYMCMCVIIVGIKYINLCRDNMQKTVVCDIAAIDMLT